MCLFDTKLKIIINGKPVFDEHRVFRTEGRGKGGRLFQNIDDLMKPFLTSLFFSRNN